MICPLPMEVPPLTILAVISCWSCSYLVLVMLITVSDTFSNKACLLLRASVGPPKGDARVGCEDSSHKPPCQLVSKSWANDLRQPNLSMDLMGIEQ